MMRTGLALILLLTVSGCARWVPAQLGTVPPGTDVRLRLSEDGAEQLEEMTGAGTTEVTGELLQWEPEVLVSTALGPSAMRLDPGLRQRLVLDPDNVVAIDVREVDRTRTGLLVGGVVAVAGSAIAWALVNIIRGSEGAPTSPTTDVPQEPFVRLRFP
ncbi:MAG: hypothetical protein OXE73_10380 [Gammaproteobacteria bacterium]|nr:hypothetical protein [Gammaproteobacteria bacterium]